MRWGGLLCWEWREDHAAPQRHSNTCKRSCQQILLDCARLLPEEQQRTFLEALSTRASCAPLAQNRSACGWIRRRTGAYRCKVYLAFETERPVCDLSSCVS